jgi:hypothetical protein
MTVDASTRLLATSHRSLARGIIWIYPRSIEPPVPSGRASRVGPRAPHHVAHDSHLRVQSTAVLFATRTPIPARHLRPGLARGRLALATSYVYTCTARDVQPNNEGYELETDITLTLQAATHAGVPSRSAWTWASLGACVRRHSSILVALVTSCLHSSTTCIPSGTLMSHEPVELAHQ